jgi:hypothetical protein
MVVSFDTHNVLRFAVDSLSGELLDTIYAQDWQSVRKSERRTPALFCIGMNLADDDGLKIKLMRIQARLTRNNRQECFRELFQWLVERRFGERWPETEDECTQLLVTELSQQVYDIALTKGWIWQQQTRRYTRYIEYFHGPGVREINERNWRDAHRLPTANEVRDHCWTDLILEWQARFLERKIGKGAPSGTGSFRTNRMSTFPPQLVILV